MQDTGGLVLLSLKEVMMLATVMYLSSGVAALCMLLLQGVCTSEGRGSNQRLTRWRTAA